MYNPQVDKIYHDSCSEYGEFCKFHDDMILLTSNIIINETIYNYETESFEELSQHFAYVSIESLKEEIHSILIEMGDDLFNKHTTYLLNELQRKLIENL